MARIISWNVNGIRSVAKKGLLEWLSEESPDIFCAQETKASPEDLDGLHLNPFGYKSYWSSAQKKGYSGVSIYTKVEPRKVQVGLGHEEFDSEGRTLTAEFKDFVLINAYFPNSQRGHERLSYKLAFCQAMLKYCDSIRKSGRNIVLCGDFNIAHKEIDLKNPKSNQNNAGFLPEERAWMDLFVAQGYVDVFRLFCKDPDCYTWWSYRPGVRERNIGWRLDYYFTNKEFAPQISDSQIMSGILGSDHCPVDLNLKPSIHL